MFGEGFQRIELLVLHHLLMLRRAVIDSRNELRYMRNLRAEMTAEYESLPAEERTRAEVAHDWIRHHHWEDGPPPQHVRDTPYRIVMAYKRYVDWFEDDDHARLRNRALYYEVVKGRRILCALRRSTRAVPQLARRARRWIRNLFEDGDVEHQPGPSSSPRVTLPETTRHAPGIHAPGTGVVARRHVPLDRRRLRDSCHRARWCRKLPIRLPLGHQGVMVSITMPSGRLVGHFLLPYEPSAWDPVSPEFLIARYGTAAPGFATCSLRDAYVSPLGRHHFLEVLGKFLASIGEFHKSQVRIATVGNILPSSHESGPLFTLGTWACARRWPAVAYYWARSGRSLPWHLSALHDHEPCSFAVARAPLIGRIDATMILQAPISRPRAATPSTINLFGVLIDLLHEYNAAGVSNNALAWARREAAVREQLEPMDLADAPLLHKVYRLPADHDFNFPFIGRTSASRFCSECRHRLGRPHLGPLPCPHVIAHYFRADWRACQIQEWIRVPLYTGRRQYTTWAPPSRITSPWDWPASLAFYIATAPLMDDMEEVD